MPLDRSDVGFTPAATSSPLGQSDPPGANDGAFEQRPPVTERVPAPSDDIGAVRHFSVRTPPFWKHRPDEWFAQLESVFVCQQINSDMQRYHTVIAGLDSETLHDVMDVLRHPPAENKYAYLKSQMLERWGNSPKQQLHELLSGLTMGDRKPTQLLRHMRQLAGDSVSDEALKVRWLDLLPATVSRTLAVLRTATLDELAQTADEIIASAPDVCALQRARQVYTPPSQPSPAPPSGASEDAQLKLLRAIVAELAELRGDNTALRAAVSQIRATPTGAWEHVSRTANHNRGRWARSPSRRSRSRSPAATDTDRSHKYCYYHWKFGTNAMRCQPPCAFNHANTPEN